MYSKALKRLQKHSEDEYLKAEERYLLPEKVSFNIITVANCLRGLLNCSRAIKVATRIELKIILNYIYLIDTSRKAIKLAVQVISVLQEST